MILYLHGFRSSPLSFKARLLGERLHALGLGDTYVCPQLPASPCLAIDLARQLIGQASPNEVTLIGSSLGGYYATWLAEQSGCRAVLLNPAVKPPRDLEQYVGVRTAFHSDEPFEFKQEYIAELQALAVPRITRPERYFLIAATGDEVLDWREMTAHYAQARQHIIDGSDHGLSDFAGYVDEVLAFCGVVSGGHR
ncbi:YqiA/YcfP family alpha/beta fold hydrolase [Janthinobacterium sp. 17J80-10]|uniref:YqiA/YcfP family alpha/beta fold hydrolase n=1 Tax=Janthinobacterium sp. 17J80-10 TaxID=2497863 RepID=UPI001005564A|nr:YqiA/YcfP family alpha/beta fold hydrolase [Janthinobacterium sp. 17J80-10]QAU33533.1 alpha/beta fold hydrolase [Janthinobacterium sp. 17J80-10]